ncbi:MAG: hypothetical protein ACXADF_08975 [Candidatus Thorarchaeota archaeon]|jgi:alanyl-tRNA synthetase
MIDKYPYWTNPEKGKFPVTIETCSKSDNHYQIGIDQEVVRAAGGGQAGDKGMIHLDDKAVQFIDTARIDGKLVLITNAAIDPGKSAIVEIDMEWRKAMMRNHTGEHLFVASLKKAHPEIELGYIWIDGDRGTVDLVGRELGIESLIEAETSVQNMIQKSIPIDTKLVKAAEISSEVRAREGLSDKHDVMRIVSVGDYDSSACSGIHVINTNDIGFFKVIDFKAKDDGCRVTFVAGDQAKKVIEATYNDVLRRKHSYPFEMEQIGDVLDKAKSTVEDRKLLAEKVVQLLTTGITSEEVEGTTFVYEYLPGLNTKDIKAILKKITMKGPTVLLLFIPGEKSSLTLSTNELPADASEYISQIIEEMGGRGGGSREVYTGGFTKTADPHETYARIVDLVRAKLKEE